MRLLTVNGDALDPEKRSSILDDLAAALGDAGRVRLLLHSIAFGNLKLLVPEEARPRRAVAALARKLGVDEAKLVEAIDVDEFSDALRRVIEDSALADRLRERGIRRAKEMSWDASARSLRTLYREVAGV